MKKGMGLMFLILLSVGCAESRGNGFDSMDWEVNRELNNPQQDSAVDVKVNRELNNPQQDSTVDVPGVTMVRSKLKREENPEVSASDLDTLVAGNTKFAFDLYKQQVKEEPMSNIFISPYSISIALAMTYAGAGSGTAQQMADTMHFTLPDERLHPAFDELSLELQSRKDDYAPSGTPFDLSFENSIWADQKLPIEQPFLDTLARYYGAGVMLVDFVKHADEAIAAINKWIEQQTHGRIKDMLTPKDVTAHTRLVLVNTIYFKAGWEYRFDETLTEDKTFHPISGSSIQLKMMEMQGSHYLLHVKTPQYEAVALPYVGDDVQILIIMPAEGRFMQFEKAMDGDAFMGLYHAMKAEYGYVTMPLFDLDYRVSLKKELKDMGMELAFDPYNADFSGISSSPLTISDVIHQTFIKLDEEGTEAAAATAVIMGDVSSSGETTYNPPPTPFHMVVDHPFIFAIYDKPTGTVLFLGRFLKP